MFTAEALPPRFRSCGARAGCVLLAGVCLLLAFGAQLRAQSKPMEYQVKAAFLYNFTKFVEWPNEGGNASSPIVIGILGEDQFGAALDNVARVKTVSGRPIVIRRLKPQDNPRGCHILFISGSERETSRILGLLKGDHVLTVGESTHFMRQGGAIAFFIENDSVKLEINPRAAEQNGLKISSKLLGVARVFSGSVRGDSR